MPGSPSQSGRTSTFGKAWDRLLVKLNVSDGVSGQPPPPKQRRVSRKQREEKRTRWLYIGLATIGIAIALIVAGTALNEFFLKPRKVLASVESEDITRRDYWKYETHSLINQSLQYQQFASLVENEQQQQYLTLAQQSQQASEEVWGSTSTNDQTISRMIDDRVYVLGLESLGLEISDAELTDYLDQQFADPAAPVLTPTPSPTLIPERADWATQTASAVTELEMASPEAVEGSPAPDELSESGGSPIPVVSGSPSTIVEDDPEVGTPEAVASTDPATPIPAPTVSQPDARETAQANIELFADDVLDDAHMSVSDYERLIAEPALARDKVEAHFAEIVGQSGEQVHASHILVGTKELADRVYADAIADPESFDFLASQFSIDEATAPNGGDLGWFPRGAMVDPFEEAAFSMRPGDISEPVQSEFGWHIIRVIENDPDRALTDEQITQSVQSMTDEWLTGQKAGMDISSPVEPTPTPAVSNFVPPADAPPPPTADELPSPQASPEAMTAPTDEEQATPET